MTDHPITPSPELIQQWYDEAKRDPCGPTNWVAVKAAQWGADQELEACCEWFVRDWTDVETADKLRAARRPQPPSLTEEALEQLASIQIDLDRHCMGATTDTIRRALKHLQELEGGNG